MAKDSRTVVVASLVGALAIALVKFAAFLVGRSHAMLTEAIHSLIDTADQVLLLIGQKRGARPPDPSHPFGYGMETYFWSFIVALLIFVMGGAVSIWQGVEKLEHPAAIAKPWVSYGVLVLSALFEGATFVIGYKQYRRTVRGRPIRLFSFLRISKDPTLFATLLEDGAALAGLVLAALGVLGAQLGYAWADGTASIAIGGLLLGIALFLGNETRSLIAGEAAAPTVEQMLRRRLQDPRVLEIESFSSLHLGPEQIIVTARLHLRSGLSGAEASETLARLSAKLQHADPRVRTVSLQPV